MDFAFDREVCVLCKETYARGHQIRHQLRSCSFTKSPKSEVTGVTELPQYEIQLAPAPPSLSDMDAEDESSSPPSRLLETPTSDIMSTRNTRLRLTLTPLTADSDTSIKSAKNSRERLLEAKDEAAYSMGLREAVEFEFMKVILTHNLSMSAGDDVLQLIRFIVVDDGGVSRAKKLPKKCSKFYRMMNARLNLNKATKTGPTVASADVPLPREKCFINNGMETIKMYYSDPNVFIDSLPNKFTYEDLIFPADDGSIPLVVDDSHTSELLCNAQKEVRKLHPHIPGLRVLAGVANSDGMPPNTVGRRSVCDWNVNYSILPRELRNSKEGRHNLGFVPEVTLPEFVGTDGDWTTFNKRLTHVADDFFMSVFRAKSETPFPLTFRKSKSDPAPITVWFIFRFIEMILDWPERMRN